MINLERQGLLVGDALKPLLSPYLAGGFRQEAYEISQIEVSGRTARALCTMPKHFDSPTLSKFHLTAVNGMVFLSQIGIAHALFLNEKREKKVEVLMTDFSITMGNMIADPFNLEVEMEIFARWLTERRQGPDERRRTPRTIYRWRFSISNRAWWGEFGLCVPLSDED